MVNGPAAVREATAFRWSG